MNYKSIYDNDDDDTYRGTLTLLHYAVPASLRQPDIEYGRFKRLLKTFLFGETAAH